MWVSILRGLIFTILLAILCLIPARSEDEAFCKLNDGNETLGYCISLKSQIRSCAKLYSWLLNGPMESEWRMLRDTVCSNDISSDSLKVCCPVDSYEESVESSLEHSNYSTHPNFNLLPHDSKCGYISLTGRIIGGQNASPGDFPWMARIGLRSKNELKTRRPKADKENQDGEIFFGCSGTIISSRYILTAAHCIPKVIDGSYSMFVRLAETDAGVDPESITVDGYIVATSPYIDFDAEEVKVHPEYTGIGGSQHDIALIRLDSEINITSSFTQPVCLPFVNEYSLQAVLNEKKILHHNSTVCGWGKTNSSDSTGSTILQSVEVPIIPNIVCRIAYKNGAEVSNNQLCAGGLKGMNSCSGDSGGPLTKIAKRDDATKRMKSVRHYQLGIVSYGKTSCGLENEPVVYTRVRSYLGWILDNMRA